MSTARPRTTPSATRVPPLLALLLAALASAPAWSYPLGGTMNRDDRERARVVGALIHTDLRVEMRGVTAGDAFAALSRATAVPIVVRSIDDPVGDGIDPAVPITLFVDRTDALTVLEMIVGQCALVEPCTWQVRHGMVEVGTKDRLIAPAAAETRTYAIGDLLIDPPYFVAPLGMGSPGLAGARAGAGGSGVASVRDFHNMPYSTAVLSPPKELSAAKAGFEARKVPDELAHEIILMIVETIEPGNWDYPEETDAADLDDHDGNARGVRGPSARRVTGDGAKAARIRRLGDRLVIRAPDFIHREINGYPRLPRPRPLTMQERADRSAAASFDACAIEVLPPERATRDPRRDDARDGDRDVEDHRRIPWLSDPAAIDDRGRSPGRDPGAAEDDEPAPGSAAGAPVLAPLAMMLLAAADPPPSDDVARSEAAAPAPAARLLGVPARGDAPRASIFATLARTRITLDARETPLRTVLDDLGRRLGVPVIGRFADDPVGHGLDPTLPITLQVDDVPALDVLEAIIAQSDEVLPPSTWQIRLGFIEVGTKARLSVPAARERRLYHIADLMLDVPVNVNERRRREVVVLETIEEIVETIEPGAWEYGQDEDLPIELPIDFAPAQRRLGVAGGDPDDAAAPSNAEDARPARRERPRYFAQPYPALLRLWRDTLIVDAPDYVHRQLAGYPMPSEAERGRGDLR